MIFLDSSFFVALLCVKDRWHLRAKDLVRTLPKRKVTSDFVVSESVTVVGALGGGKAGAKLYNFVMDNCEVVFVDRELLEKAIATYLKYDGTLSLADAVAVEIMRGRGIRKICSFDTDFDKVPGISRIH